MDDNMQNNQNIDVVPYKASGNLNTAINNPTANINDTMNVNIQNTAINNPTANINDTMNINIQNPAINTMQQVPVSNIGNNLNLQQGNNQMLNTNNAKTNEVSNTQNNSVENKTYVTTDNKPKKKLTLNLGSEFKIALLIVVILLVFVFLMPIIMNLFKPH